MENYFILENDFIGYLYDGQKFYSYTEAVKGLHEFIQEFGKEVGHQRSKWNVELVRFDKTDKYGDPLRKPVYKISQKQAVQYGII